MAADPEMELLEKQLQQTVDTCNTLLEAPAKKKKKIIGDQKMVERRGEGARDSQSEGEDNQSEEDLLDKAQPLSLSDQMSLLSPGPQQPAARELSPAESLQEESLHSTSQTQPVPTTHSPAVATTEPRVGSAPTSTDFSTPIPGTTTGTTSTKSSPGTASEQETPVLRPRSHSCDSKSSKPLMIPSNIPPWLEMVCVSMCFVGKITV